MKSNEIGYSGAHLTVIDSFTIVVYIEPFFICQIKFLAMVILICITHMSYRT